MIRLAMWIGPIVPAAVMTYIGLKHNAMGEFYATDVEAAGPPAVDFGYLLLHFASWYVAALLALFLVRLSVKAVRTVVRRRLKPPDAA